MNGTVRIVLVGCGAKKRDRTLEPGTLRVKRWPAKDLYTSTYFRKKREYAETVGDQWAVLSAEHGVLAPDEKTEPYDTTVDNLDKMELEGWADLVLTQLEEWTSWELADGADEIVVEMLAGRSYLEPIRPTLSGVDGPITFRYPFDATNGIGEQIGWLSEQVETVATDGGCNVQPGTDRKDGGSP